MLIASSTWQSQVWYPTLLKMLIEKPLLLPHNPYLLLNQQGQIHPSITNKTLRLVVWKISGKGRLRQEFQRGLPTYFQVQVNKAHYEIIICHGQSRITGVVEKKTIHFDVL